MKQHLYLISYGYDSPFANIIRAKTKSRYNHSAISLTKDLSPTYTFMRERTSVDGRSYKNGFSEESVQDILNKDESAIMKIVEVDVDGDQYDKAVALIRDFKNNASKTSYDFLNVVAVALNATRMRYNLPDYSFVCSEFIAYVMTEIDRPICNKPINLTLPHDVARANVTMKNTRVIYDGKVSTYTKRFKFGIYDKPYSYDEIVHYYGRGVADKLMQDPAHKFRAETGIELIHKEPTIDELHRIYNNFKSMDKKLQNISDEKSMELYGMDNETHYHELLKEYNVAESYVLETKRSNLPDSEFGVPEERKYPLDTKKHVYSAIKLFNHVKPEYEAELARNIIKKMERYKITDVSVGPNNRFGKYYKKGVIEKMDILTEAKKYKIVVDKTELQKSINEIMKSDDPNIVKLGKAMDVAIREDFEHPNALLGTFNLVLLMGLVTPTILVIMISVLAIMVSMIPATLYVKLLSAHKKFLKSRLKPDDVTKSYYLAIDELCKTGSIDAVVLESGLVILTEAPKSESDSEENESDDDESQEDDNTEDDSEGGKNDEETPKENESDDDEDGEIEPTTDVDSDDEPIDDDDGEDSSVDYSDDVSDPDDDGSPDEAEDYTSDVEPEENESEDETEPEGDDLTATDFAGDFVEPVDTDDIDSDKSSQDESEMTSDEPTADAGEDTATDFTDDVSGDESGSDEETPEDETEPGAEEPADFTDGMGDVGSEDGDTAEEESSEDEITDDSIDEDGDDNNKLQNSIVKNYNLMLDFEKFYNSVEDILKHLKTVNYSTSIQNSVLDRCVHNLTELKTQLLTYIEYDYSNDYKINLYYYTTYMQGLKIILEMLKSIQMLNKESNNNLKSK